MNPSKEAIETSELQAWLDADGLYLDVYNAKRLIRSTLALQQQLSAAQAKIQKDEEWWLQEQKQLIKEAPKFCKIVEEADANPEFGGAWQDLLTPQIIRGEIECDQLQAECGDLRMKLFVLLEMVPDSTLVQEIRTRTQIVADQFQQLQQEVERLKRGEYICQECGIRKDGEAPEVDF